MLKKGRYSLFYSYIIEPLFKYKSLIFSPYFKTLNYKDFINYI
jgi:hypothetical protein